MIRGGRTVSRDGVAALQHLPPKRRSPRKSAPSARRPPAPTRPPWESPGSGVWTGVAVSVTVTVGPGTVLVTVTAGRPVLGQATPPRAFRSAVRWHWTCMGAFFLAQRESRHKWWDPCAAAGSLRRRNPPCAFQRNRWSVLRALAQAAASDTNLWRDLCAYSLCASGPPLGKSPPARFGPVSTVRHDRSRLGEEMADLGSETPEQ